MINCGVSSSKQRMYGTTRPYFRSSLARAVYEKIRLDEEIGSMNKDVWYQCNLNVLPASLCDTFLKLNFDEDTSTFVDMCYDKADWFFTQLYHSIFRSILGWFMTQTSINSWLRRGSMFVFSRSQFVKLMGANDSWVANTMLDLGAGDGNVTSVIAPHFRDVHVTETSAGMRSILKEKGFRVVDAQSWAESATEYDVISLLNILDRCSHPRTMLTQAKNRLVPVTGRIVVALALAPFTPYVEDGTPDHLPVERVHLKGHTFEEQVASVQETLFTPLGLETERWTRVPYLCEGDLGQSFYWLQDAIFILRPLQYSPSNRNVL